MAWLNSERGYGSLTKLLHWAVFAAFVFQYAVAAIMLRLATGETALGLTGDTFYNWHKSMGLVALLLAAARLWSRRSGELPPWAPTLSETEKRFIHRAEQVLYTAMFVMPVSGFVYVMAGGYGVDLFGAWQLPNPIGRSETMAIVAKWVHVVSAYVLLAAIAGHVGLVLRHQFILRDGLLWRMLPGNRDR